jgi:hypothetical protein
MLLARFVEHATAAIPNAPAAVVTATPATAADLTADPDPAAVTGEDLSTDGHVTTSAAA